MGVLPYPCNNRPPSPLHFVPRGSESWLGSRSSMSDSFVTWHTIANCSVCSRFCYCTNLSLSLPLFLCPSLSSAQLTAILLIMVGTTIQAIFGDFSLFIDTHFSSPPALLIAIGFILIAVATLGTYGAVKESVMLINLVSKR